MKKIFISVIALAVVATAAYPGVSSAETVVREEAAVRRPCMAIDSDLFFGVRNPHVSNIQLILKLYGFLKVEPTGYFGILTREAVKEFQRAHGLPPTGFFGPLSRGVMKKLTCADDMPMPVGEVTYRVSTDKSSYDQNEKIKITITAHNTTNESKTLKFTNGCQTDYTIGNVYTYLAARLCIQALSEVVIPAKRSYTWTMTHDPAEFKLPVGTHTLVAKVVGHGEAKTTIVIKGEVPTVTVTAPNGGEKWQVGDTEKISWKSHMPYPTFAAVRYNISLVKKYVCTSQVCPAIAYAPKTIVKGVVGDSYQWRIRDVEPGEYWIQVCMDGNTICDMSDETFRIVRGAIFDPA